MAIGVLAQPAHLTEQVPHWLAMRVRKVGGALVESILENFGAQELLLRMGQPLWFQAFGCGLGLDWHDSAFTSPLMLALRKSLNPRSRDYGIAICGGSGKLLSRKQQELTHLAARTGLDANYLVRVSRLTTRIDNNAIDDGHRIDSHSVVVADSGEWVVIQHGINEVTASSRRYHWSSKNLKSFTLAPHLGIVGEGLGPIMNLVDANASAAQRSILELLAENPQRSMSEIRKALLPLRKEIELQDPNLKRLGSVLAFAYEQELKDFSDVLLLEGVGSNTLLSLGHACEIIYGNSTQFEDPARYSFSEMRKSDESLPVSSDDFAQMIEMLKIAFEKAKLERSEKADAFNRLAEFAEFVEGRLLQQSQTPPASGKKRGKKPKKPKKQGVRAVLNGARSPIRRTRKIVTAGANQLSLFT